MAGDRAGSALEALLGPVRDAERDWDELFAAPRSRAGERMLAQRVQDFLGAGLVAGPGSRATGVHEGLFCLDRGVYGAFALMPGLSGEARGAIVRRLLCHGLRNYRVSGEGPLAEISVERRLIRYAMPMLLYEDRLRLVESLARSDARLSLYRRPLLRALLQDPDFAWQAVAHRKRLHRALLHLLGREQIRAMGQALARPGCEGPAERLLRQRVGSLANLADGGVRVALGYALGMPVEDLREAYAEAFQEGVLGRLAHARADLEAALALPAREMRAALIRNHHCSPWEAEDALGRRCAHGITRMAATGACPGGGVVEIDSGETEVREVALNLRRTEPEGHGVCGLGKGGLLRLGVQRVAVAVETRRAQDRMLRRWENSVVEGCLAALRADLDRVDVQRLPLGEGASGRRISAWAGGAREQGAELVVLLTVDTQATATPADSGSLPPETVHVVLGRECGGARFAGEGAYLPTPRPLSVLCSALCGALSAGRGTYLATALRRASAPALEEVPGR